MTIRSGWVALLALCLTAALPSGCTVAGELEPDPQEEPGVLAAFELPEVELGMRLQEVEARRPAMRVGGYGVYHDSIPGYRVEFSFSPARSNTEGQPSPARSKLTRVVIHSPDASRRDWESLFRRIEAVKGAGGCVEGVRGELSAEWPGVALRTQVLLSATRNGTEQVHMVRVVIGADPLEGHPLDCTEGVESFTWPDLDAGP